MDGAGDGAYGAAGGRRGTHESSPGLKTSKASFVLAGFYYDQKSARRQSHKRKFIRFVVDVTLFVTLITG